MSGGIMSVATAIRSIGAAATITATEVAKAAEDIERTWRETGGRTTTTATEVAKAAEGIERTRRETGGRTTTSSMNAEGGGATGGMGAGSGSGGGNATMTTRGLATALSIARRSL
jgi:hypothetical protein